MALRVRISFPSSPKTVTVLRYCGVEFPLPSLPPTKGPAQQWARTAIL